MPHAPQAGTTSSRWRRWGLGVLGLVLVVLALDGLTRLVTWLQYRGQLRDFPQLQARIDETDPLRAALTVGVLIDRAAIYPALIPSSDGELRVVPFGELEPTDFAAPPTNEAPTPGRVRIAFLGSSSTRAGYPEQIQALLDAQLGEGRVEVLDLGVANSHSATTALLAERFLPRYQPHIVVTYLGFDDLVFYRGRARAIAQAARREADFEDPGLTLGPRSRGLLDLLRERETTEPLAWMDRTWITEPIATYWELDRLVAELGGELWVTSFAVPGDQGSPADERYFDAELRLLWPVLEGRATYLADVEAYNAALAEFAARSGAPLVDVAAAVRGGRDLFADNAHLTAEGRALQAQVVADALLPRARALLDAGAAPPRARTLPRPAPLAPASAPALEPGRCVQGPCPDQTCYVPAGPVYYGNDPEDLEPILARQRAGIGVAEEFWFEDETPEVELAVSAFCVDRTEARADDHRRCQREGACPQTYAARSAPTPGEPANFPTLADARAFCAWRGGRLPTDVEFDAAARGHDRRLMPWGDVWTGREANYCGAECEHGDPADAADGFDSPAPIGSFDGVSPHGAVDMAGNLWEWIDECFDSSTHRRFPPGTRDPITGPQDECRRFLRGGSYRSYAGVLERRTASGMPDTDIPTRGARCVFDFGTEHQVVSQQGGTSHE